MARGKHSARSQRRRAEIAAGAAESVARRAARERDLAEAAKRRHVEAKRLRSEIAGLEAQVRVAIDPALRELAKEITACESLLAELALTKHEVRRNERELREDLRETGETFLEFTERLDGEIYGHARVVVLGVDERAAKRIGPDAVKAIQKARGIRRPGAGGARDAG